MRCHVSGIVWGLALPDIRGTGSLPAQRLSCGSLPPPCCLLPLCLLLGPAYHVALRSFDAQFPRGRFEFIWLIDFDHPRHGVQGAGCRVQDFGCRVQGMGCRVQGAGCSVWVKGAIQGA